MGDEYEIVACTSTTDRICKKCRKTCGNGYYMSKTTCVDSDIKCSSCRVDCGAGEYEYQNCTTSSNRECRPCNDGYFQSEEKGVPQCQQCKTCGKREYETGPCTKTKDRQCAPCSLTCKDALGL